MARAGITDATTARSGAGVLDAAITAVDRAMPGRRYRRERRIVRGWLRSGALLPTAVLTACSDAKSPQQVLDRATKGVLAPPARAALEGRVIPAAASTATPTPRPPSEQVTAALAVRRPARTVTVPARDVLDAARAAIAALESDGLPVGERPARDRFRAAMSAQGTGVGAVKAAQVLDSLYASDEEATA
jgi:hypothetical protein